MVPVLVGSFHEFLAGGGTPGESPEIEAFVAAVRAAADGHSGAVCCVSAADFAHVGRRFGDPWLLDAPRLETQTARDRKLLQAVCRHDSEGFYRAVAEQEDSGRICGLSPTYAMLAVMRPARGRLLKYAQAVDEDRTGCVSFAAAAFYRD